MVESREEVITLINETLVNENNIDLCILYGSAARDRLSPLSDIDIAIGSVHSITNENCFELSRKMTLLFDRETSIFNIEKMEGVILQEVLSKGITLKNSHPDFKAAFISKMYEFSEDILPYQMAAIKEKVSRLLNE
jgi:predicted nucleotidyltransferase